MNTSIPSLPDPPTPPTAAGPETLSAELRALSQQFHDGPVRIRDLIEATHHRGQDLLLILLCLPFLTPIPLPFISTPVGLVILFISIRRALGRKHKEWPEAWLNKELPGRFFPAVLQGASKLMRGIEWITRPRLDLFFSSWTLQRLNGVIMSASAILLILPLFVPLSNFFPAATIFLFTIASLGRDGLFYLAGVIMFGLGLLFFAMLSYGGFELIERLVHKVTG